MKRLLPLLILAGLIGGFFALGLNRSLSLDTLLEHGAALRGFVAAYPLTAALAFLGAYILAVGTSLPVGTAMTLTGGWLFGLWAGAALSILGATGGAGILFLFIRLVVGDTLRTRAGPYLRRMAEGFQRDAFSYLLSLRLIPVFPFWAVNLAPVLLGMRLRPYLAATLIGVTPSTIAYASIGDGLGLAADAAANPMAQLLTPAQIALRAGLAALALLPIAIRWGRRNPRP